jgi:hypothetical protein
MRFIVIGLLIAVVIFAISGGHVLFLPLLFLLPLGGGLFGRRVRGDGPSRPPYARGR